MATVSGHVILYPCKLRAFLKLCYFLSILLTSGDELLNYVNNAGMLSYKCLFFVSEKPGNVRKTWSELKKNFKLWVAAGQNGGLLTAEPLRMAVPPDGSDYVCRNKCKLLQNVVWRLVKTFQPQRVKNKTALNNKIMKHLF